jgi:glutathione synthase/RimK-type ligase-like ATP-grasp enzyme
MGSPPAAPRPLPPPTQLALDAAARLGWPTRVLDAEFGYLWELTLPDGRVRAIPGSRTPVNDAAAAQLAGDKHFTGCVLADAGFRVPETVRALSPFHFRGALEEERTGLRPAQAFARARGYPLIVKPNRLSHGRCVAVVRDQGELERAIAAVWEHDRVALVQEYVEGRELRLDLLDGELLAGYERRPLRVRGDGRCTALQLLAALDPRFGQEDGRAKLAASVLVQRLERERGPLASLVLAADEELVLDEQVMNLNRLCTAVPIPRLPEPWRAHCAAIAARLGLRLAGLDLRLPCSGEPLVEDPRRATVLEVNATPLLVQLSRMGHRELALAGMGRILRALVEPPPGGRP